MQLANPWGLLALLSVPALLILFSLRPTRRTVLLSSTTLWREALGERQRGLGLQKLLRNLSLLALLLFALVASLGLADPGWVTRSTLPGDAVVIIDVSASMQANDGDRTRFERAMREAEALVDALSEDARMLMIASGRNARLLSAFESDKATLHAVLAKLTPTDEAGRPASALALALSLLRSRERGRVYFLTDAAFDERVDFTGPSVEYRVFGAPARNVAITRFDVRREIGAVDRFQVLLTIRNYTREPITVPATVHLDERPILERSLQLPPRGEETVVVPYLGETAGRARANIDFADDLAADNQAFAVLGADETLRVALFTAGNFYLESALAALPGAVVNTHDEAGPNRLSRAATTHDLVVLDGLDTGALPPGNYLLIDTLPAGLPFTETGPAVRRPRIEGTGASALVRGLDLAGVRIDAARRVDVDENAQRVQRLFWSAETELALAFIGDDTRVVYLGFDLARSNFPLQAAFPLFVQHSVAWLRGTGGRNAPTQLAAGEPVSIRVPPDQSRVILRTPHGEGLVHEVAGGELVFDATSQSGIYRYTEQGTFGDTHRYFAVNLADETESDINARAPLPARSAATPSPDALARVTVAWWPFLTAAALMMLALESCLGVRRRRSA